MSEEILLCRFCMTTKELCSIYTEYDEVRYFDMAKVFANVNMKEDDILPKSICNMCIINLKICFTFKKQMQNSECILTDMCKNISRAGLSLIEQSSEGNTSVPIKCEKVENETVINDTNTTLEQDENGKDSVPLKCENVENETVTNDNNTTMEQDDNGKDSVPHTTMERDENGKDSVQHTTMERDENGKDSVQHSNDPTELQLNIENSNKNNVLLKNTSITSKKYDDKSHTYGSIEKKPKSLISDLPTNTKKKSSLAHQCEQCGHIFKQKSVLIQHLNTHIGIKQFNCELCDKRFTRSCHLVVHMRIHNNLKPFICDSCGRGFTKSSDLLRHKRIHTDIKNYPCTVCLKRFRRSADVISHMRSHTGYRPYSCSVCDKTYTRHSGLAKHIKTTGHLS